MALKEYRRKRTFGKTPEPGPSRPGPARGGTSSFRSTRPRTFTMTSAWSMPAS